MSEEHLDTTTRNRAAPLKASIAPLCFLWPASRARYRSASVAENEAWGLIVDLSHAAAVAPTTLGNLEGVANVRLRAEQLAGTDLDTLPGILPVFVDCLPALTVARAEALVARLERVATRRPCVPVVCDLPLLGPRRPWARGSSACSWP